MLKQRILRWAFLTTGILVALDLSSCGPTGDLMEILIPIIVTSLAT